MARKRRIEYPGAFYHVMSRGNRKEEIFLQNSDMKRFVGKLGEYKDKHGYLLYAYVLMRNHIHLLLETRDTPLSRTMQGIVQSHTQYYNTKYSKVGHVFQGRYKAILCEKDSYLLNLVRYIHLNPVRAAVVESPSIYEWSSHRAYLSMQEGNLVDTDLVLSQFSKNRRTAAQLFEGFVGEWSAEGKKKEFYEVVDQRFLGDEDFVREAKTGAGEFAAREEIVSRDKRLPDIAKKVEQITGIVEQELRGKGRQREAVEARSLFVRLSLLYTKHSRKDIAIHLNRVPRNISYLEQRICEDKWQRAQERLGW